VRRLIHHARQCDMCGRTCISSAHCVEASVFHLNDHAFTYVAIYSRGYTDSARDVHQLFVLNGVDEVVHDDLTGFVLGAAAFASGAVTALVAFLSSNALGDAELAHMHAVAGFLIGTLCTGCCLEIVSAFSASLYVCFTEVCFNILGGSAPLVGRPFDLILTQI
jgi:hypothetical protein